MGKTKLDVAAAKLAGTNASAGAAVHAEIGLMYILPGRACGRACDPCGEGGATSSDFALAGSGIALYFILEKALVWLFVLYTIALAPNMILNTGGSLRGGIGLSTLSQTMLGQVSNSSGLAFARISGAVTPLSPEHVPAVYSIVDISACLLFSAGVLYLMGFMDRLKSDTSARSVGTEDYTVQVGGLERVTLCGCGGPQGCACGLCAATAMTPELLAAHFEKVAQAFTRDYQVVRSLNGRPEVHLAGADLRALRLFRKRAALLATLQQAQQRLLALEKSIGIKKGSVWIRKKPRYLRILREFLDHASAHRERVLSARLADKEEEANTQAEWSRGGGAGLQRHASSRSSGGGADSDSDDSRAAGQQGGGATRSPAPLPSSRRRMASSRMLSSDAAAAATSEQPASSPLQTTRATPVADSSGTPSRGRGSLAGAVGAAGGGGGSSFKRRASGKDVAVLDLADLLSGKADVMTRARTAEQEYAAHEQRVAQLATSIPDIPLRPASGPAASPAGAPARGVAKAGSDSDDESSATSSLASTQSADEVYADLEDAASGPPGVAEREGRPAASSSSSRRTHSRSGAAKDPNRNVTVRARRRASSSSLPGAAPDLSGPPPEDDIPPLGEPSDYVRKGRGLACQPCCLSRSASAEWQVQQTRSRIDDLLYDIESLTRTLTRYTSRQEVEEEFDRQRARAEAQASTAGGAGGAQKVAAGAGGAQKASGFFGWLSSRNVVSEKQEKSTLSIHLSSRALTAGPAASDTNATTASSASRPIVKDSRPPHRQIVRDPMVAYVTFESAETAAAVLQLYSIGSLELLCRNGRALVVPPKDSGGGSTSSSAAGGQSSQSVHGQPHTSIVVAAKQGRRGEGPAGRETRVIVRSSGVDDDEEEEEEEESSEGEADRKGRSRRTAAQRRSVSSRASKAASADDNSDSGHSSEEEDSDSSEQGGTDAQSASASTTLERVNLRFMGQTLRVTRAPPPDTVLWMNLYTGACERLLRRTFAFIVSASIILGSFAVLYGAQVLTDAGRQLQGTQESAMCSYLSLADTSGLVTYQGSVWARLPAGRALSLGALEYGLTGESASPPGLVSINASQYLLEAAPRLAQGPNASCPSTGYSGAIWQSRPGPAAAAAYVPWATLLNSTRSTCRAFLNASDALALLLALDSPSMPATVVAVAREPLLVDVPPSVRSCYCSALFFTQPTLLLPANTQDFLARVQTLLAAKPAVKAGIAVNMTVLRNGTFELVPSTDVPPTEAAPLDTCASWLVLYSGYSGLLGLAALVVVLTNSGVLLFLERTVEWDRYNSYETERISLLLRSLAMQFLNTALLALLVSANIPTIPVATPGQRYADFTPQWYVSRGPGIVLTMVLQALVPHLQRILESIVWRCRRTCGATGGAQTQAQLNSFYTGPDFPLSQRYAENLTVVFVCLFYGTGIPVLILVAAAHFLLGYVTDLLLFVFYYKKPPKEDMRVGRIALGLIPLAILLHLLLGGWMLSSSAVYAVSGGSTLGSYGVIPGLDQALDLAEGWLRPTPTPAPTLNCTAYYLNSSSVDVFTAAACNGTQWASNATQTALVSVTASATASPSSVFSTASPSGSASASATGTSSAAGSATAVASVSASFTASASASARSSVSATATVGTARRLLQAESSPPPVSTAPPPLSLARPRVLQVAALQLPPSFTTNGTRPGLPTLSDIQGYVDLASLAAAGLVDYSAETLVAILERFRVPYVLPFGLFALAWFLFLCVRQLWLVLLVPLLRRALACCAVPRKICRFCCMSCWNPRSGCCWLTWLYCCACGREPGKERGDPKGKGKEAAGKGVRKACQLSCSTQCCGGSPDDAASPSEVRVAPPAIDTTRGDLSGFAPPMKWLSIVAAKKIEAGKLPDLGAVVKHMLEDNDGGVPDAESVGFSKSMIAAERRARRGGCCLCLCKTLCCCFVCCFPALFGWDLHKEDGTGSKGKAKEGKNSRELTDKAPRGAAKGPDPRADAHAGIGGPAKQRACCRFYFCGGFIDCGRKRYRAGDISEDRRFAYVPAPSFSQALALRLLSDTPTYNVLASRRVLDALFPASEQAMLFGRYSTLTQAALFAPLDPHEDPNAPGPDDGDEVELSKASAAGKGKKGKKRRASPV